MKIGLDLRFFEDGNMFSNFVRELIIDFIKLSPENEYNIYTNSKCDLIELPNICIQKVDIKIWSLKEQTKFYKILKKDNNTLMLFFDIHKPLRYKGEYYIFIPSLNNIYYQDFKKYSEKYKYLFFLNKSLKNAKKIICFDENTKDELTERLDIDGKKVSILTPFFTNQKELEKSHNIKIDIKTKNNIKNDFFIYNWWFWIEKNIDRLISVFERLNKTNKKIDLVVFWDELSKDLNIRNLVISKNMQNNIHFLWEIKNEEKRNYYSSSLWVIFPSLYEPFPFSLNEAIFYNTKILTSNLKNIKDIFWNHAYYFSPISASSIIENINLFYWNKSKVDYSSIIKKINSENTIKDLKKIIN